MNCNPYAPAVKAAGYMPGVSLTQPVRFGGSMSLEEGRQVELLVAGKQNSAAANNANLLPLTRSQMISFAIFGVVVLAFSADSIAFGELQELAMVLVGVLTIVVGLAAVAYHEWVRRASRDALKSESRGVFTEVEGCADEHGIEFLINGFRIRYQWEDFVGCRISTHAAILYERYPQLSNCVAASLFDDHEQWERVRQTLKMHVPMLGKLPRLQARRPSAYVLHTAAGIKALERKRWKSALAHYEAALAVRPEDAQALHGRMVATHGLGDPDNTLAAVEAVVQSGEANPTTRQIRAAALCDTNRYAEALEDLDYLIEQFEDNGDWWTGRSLAYCKLEKYDEAVHDATRAIELDPKNVIALNNRGYARLHQGVLIDAINDLEAAVALAPDLERPRQLLDEARQMVVGIE